MGATALLGVAGIRPFAVDPFEKGEARAIDVFIDHPAGRSGVSAVAGGAASSRLAARADDGGFGPQDNIRYNNPRSAAASAAIKAEMRAASAESDIKELAKGRSAVAAT